MNELQQAQLEMEALFLLIAELGMRAQHNLQEACQVFFAEACGDTSETSSLIGRGLKQRRLVSCHLRHQGVTQETNHLPRKMLRIVSFHKEAIQQTKHLFAGITRHRVYDLFEPVG